MVLRFPKITISNNLFKLHLWPSLPNLSLTLFYSCSGHVSLHIVPGLQVYFPLFAPLSFLLLSPDISLPDIILHVHLYV